MSSQCDIFPSMHKLALASYLFSFNSNWDAIKHRNDGIIKVVVSVCNEANLSLKGKHDF